MILCKSGLSYCKHIFLHIKRHKKWPHFFQFANRYKQAMVRFLFLLISVSLLVYQANAQTDGNPHVGGYLRNSMWVIINYQSLSSLFLYNSLTELGPQKAM